MENAHGHLKNHKSGWQRNKAAVKKIHDNTTNGLVSLYPFPLYFDDCCRDLDLAISDMSSTPLMEKIWDYQKQDYTNMLEWLICDQQIPVIYVAFDPVVRGYMWSTRSLGGVLSSSKKVSHISELKQEYQDIFFSQSQNAWTELGLTAVWDIRERMALDMKPFAGHWGDNLLLAHDHSWIHCQDLWFDTEQTIRNLMSWLDLDIVEENLTHWLPIMRSWQQIHNKILRFPRHLPKILRSIVHGHKHDISYLTFEQEVIIQHCLIYQYGMNLKTWNLDKFPNCTSEMHSLLEQNHHPLS